MSEEEANKPVVVFLGPKASYTHQATLDSFSEHDYTLSPQITIEDIFAAVQNGSAYRGVVPFENSSNGSVVFTLDLLADLNEKYSDILVCGEAYIAVQHCLIGRYPPNWSTAAPIQHHAHAGPHGLSSIIESPLSSGAVTPTAQTPVPAKPTARPLADLNRIHKLYSHPQAWGQCKTFLNTYLKGIERQDVSSTSKAAELVANDENGESAAISSNIAAKMMGLDLLAKDIEDRADNCTRFFVLRKRGITVTSSSHPASTVSSTPSTSVSTDQPKPSPEHIQHDSRDKHDNFKTLVSFTIDHANPGSLANSLAVFETYGLNLTSINTRPSGVENWNYIFFVEIKGRRQEGHNDGAVNRALRDLDKMCRGWRWLGSWENRLKR